MNTKFKNVILVGLEAEGLSTIVEKDLSISF